MNNNTSIETNNNNSNKTTYDFTIVFKPYERKQPALDDISKVYVNNVCIVAKNQKHDALYVHRQAKIVKGKFKYSAGSVSYPILWCNKEVYIKVKNFIVKNSNSNNGIDTDNNDTPLQITTDQYWKQNNVYIRDFVKSNPTPHQQ